ncbi:MAG: hypothetical protein V1776_05690 [Candidatus Diapherotrites archaeon]
MDARAQTSLELLMVVSFSILLALIISIPFLENQARTNAGIQAKLAVLPYIERNTELLKISSITAEKTTPAGTTKLTVMVHTKGKIDSVISNELSSSGCLSICSQIKSGGFFDSVDFSWENDTLPSNVCSIQNC